MFAIFANKTNFIVFQKVLAKMFRNSVSKIVALTVILTVLSSCNSKRQYRAMDGVVWHTTYRITYNASTDLSAGVLAAMDSVEMSLSPFQTASLISAINRNEGDSVDQHIAYIFANSKRVNQLSGGAFDPTVAPLVNLWGFGYEKPIGEPTQAQIDSCLALVGIADCQISDGRMIKKHRGTQFNFSAITKGYGCDRAAEALRRNGCSDYMVEIGGEIAVSGNSPHGGKWNVMVDAPVEGDTLSGHGVTVIHVSNCGIATSGNYRNYRDTSSGRVGHTISPVTGRPIHSEILSATVIAPTTMEADALATASMAMPREQAMAMIDGLGQGYAAMFVLHGGGDSFKLEKSSLFDSLTAE